MKKIVLAIVAATACYSANAATVYDKDGTTFAVGGRVQAVVYNGKSSKVGDKDNSLRNTARLNVSGNTKVLTGFQFMHSQSGTWLTAIKQVPVMVLIPVSST